MELFIFLYFLYLALGFALLWVSGEMCVRYSVKTAHLFKVTTLFIGFFLIAISTGFPELAVIFISAFKKVPSIAVGTMIGSVIANIGFALAIPAFLVKSISVTKKESRNLIIMLVFSLIAIIFVFYIQNLGNLAGLILIFSYIIAIWWIYKNQTTLRHAKIKKEDARVVANNQPGYKIFWTSKLGVLIKLSASLGLLFFASEITVRAIIKIAEYFSLSMSIVGATISGTGTSLPELLLSIQAVRKREFSLALGNIVGSVLEVATFLLGAAVLVSPTIVSLKSLNSMIPFLVLTLGTTIFALAKDNAFKRIYGILVFLIFIIFMIYHLFFSREL
ncbi:MAG: hypothetical protein ABIA74_02930 [bacterium]